MRTSVLMLSLPDLTPYVLPGLFWTFSLLAVLSAMAAATAPKIVHAAFGLMAAFFGVAGLYFLLGADFVGLAQIIIYVGGILVLLVFGILLTSRTMEMLGMDRPPRATYAVVAGGLAFLGLGLAILETDFNGRKDLPDPTPTTADLGRALLDPQQFLVPFELSSVLLLAALVGAAYLARRRRT